MIITKLFNKIKNIRLIIFLLIVISLSISTPNIELTFAAPNTGTSSITSKTKSIRKKAPRRRRVRRSYNPERTKHQALDMIRRHSETLCDLANLEPILDESDIIIDDQEDIEEIGDIQFCETQINDAADYYSEQNYPDEEIESNQVDIQTFKTLWLSYVDDTDYNEYTYGGIHKQTLMTEIISWLGTPYKFGGMSRNAIDCSAFVQKIFFDAANIELPRTARTQIHVGDKIRREELKFGDLIFFHTYTYRFASHVGIYLADGLFAHASSRYGVTVSSLNSNYYSSHYIGARRINISDFDQYANN